MYLTTVLLADLVMSSEHTSQKVLLHKKYRTLPSSEKSLKAQFILYVILKSFSIISNLFHCKQLLVLRKLILELRQECEKLLDNG